MNAPARQRILQSPGPIADAFTRSRAFIKFCVGPVGSGKTIAGLNSGLLLAAAQGAVPGPGGVMVRSARIGVIRESYPALRATTLKSWFRIVPESEGKFNWTPPFTHKFRKVLARDPRTGAVREILDCEYEFRGIGEQSVEEACRGWEVNGAIVDEGDLQPPDLIPFLTGRVGRFSDLDPALVVDPQIIAMMNMPDVENHAYQLAMDRELPDMDDDTRAALAAMLQGRPLIETFIQPGGMEPDAENLHNLPGGRGYYAIQIAANKHKPGYVDRMVHNKPVPLMHGQPVNQGFLHSRHVSDVSWDKSRKLIIGIDNGYTAAAVMLQRDMLSRIRTIREVVNRDRRGNIVAWSGEAFGRQVRRVLLDDFPGIRPDQVVLVADPAAFKGKDSPRDVKDWVKSVENAIGFGPIRKAKSNSPSLRNEAIWKAQSQVDGYLVDRSCKHLIKGHAGGYRYAKSTLHTGEEKGDVPIADTVFTHVCDAEQYAALEGEHVLAQVRGQSANARPPIVNVSDYDAFNYNGG